MNQITLRCLETAALIVFDPAMSKLQMSATTLYLVGKPSLADPVNRDDEPCVSVYMCLCVCVYIENTVVKILTCTFDWVIKDVCITEMFPCIDLGVMTLTADWDNDSLVIL